MLLQFKRGILVLTFAVLACSLPCLAETQQQFTTPDPEQSNHGQQNISSATDRLLPGSISGTVFDESGAMVVGARLSLLRDSHSPVQEILSGTDGQFSFTNVTPGPFTLTISAVGFANQTSSGILQPGVDYVVKRISLPVATAVTDVEVGLTQTEVAAEEVKIEEKQRVLGAIPNFYVSYRQDAAPLTPKQKFGLAWKTTIDPITFVVVGATAGIQQAQDDFDGYGQGAQGYAKRYGASYADFVIGTYIGGAILPAVLKQDPRYFYKGTGSKRSRFFYAMASAVICKGDNGRWQANYSNIIGSLAAGGISNLYYPSKDREGAGLTFETGAIGIGATGAANIVQEFIVRKLTPKLPKQNPSKP